MTASPTWLEGAQRYRPKSRHAVHHDGTCDSMYPGTSVERDGRCVLAEGHEGAHVYRREGVDALTREQAYRLERERKNRNRLRRARVARAERAAGCPA